MNYSTIILTTALSVGVGVCAHASDSAADVPSGSQRPETSVELPASSEARLLEVERSLAGLQRKLRLLGADEDAWLGGEELWDEPSALLSYAKKLAGDRRHVEAYHLLQLFHAKFPDSEDDKEALRVARGIFGSYYFRTRHHERQGTWVVTEPLALFQWVNGYRAAEVFPELLTSVLRGLPYPFYQDYLDFTDKHYRNDFNWAVTVTKDNGIIDSVSVVAVEVEAEGDVDAE